METIDQLKSVYVNFLAAVENNNWQMAHILEDDLRDKLITHILDLDMLDISFNQTTEYELELIIELASLIKRTDELNHTRGYA